MKASINLYIDAWVYRKWSLKISTRRNWKSFSFLINLNLKIVRVRTISYRESGKLVKVDLKWSCDKIRQDSSPISKIINWLRSVSFITIRAFKCLVRYQHVYNFYLKKINEFCKRAHTINGKLLKVTNSWLNLNGKV